MSALVDMDGLFLWRQERERDLRVSEQVRQRRQDDSGSGRGCSEATGIIEGSPRMGHETPHDWTDRMTDAGRHANVGAMLGQRRRRCPSITPALDPRFCIF